MDQRFQQRFPGHEIRWAFTSRMVKGHVRKLSRVDMHSPGEVLEALYAEGHSWAVVLVGHGTDHPAWTAYFALKSILRQSCRPKIFVGMIEGQPSQSRVVGAVFRSGIKKVRLIPFTLVAGVHFQEDIAGDEDSWKAAFESIGVTVEVETRGIGYRVPGTHHRYFFGLYSGCAFRDSGFRRCLY